MIIACILQTSESAYNINMFSIHFHNLIEFPLEYNTFNSAHINSKNIIVEYHKKS
jgi:hypothetical protein